MTAEDRTRDEASWLLRQYGQPGSQHPPKPEKKGPHDRKDK